MQEMDLILSFLKWLSSYPNIFIKNKTKAFVPVITGPPAPYTGFLYIAQLFLDFPFYSIG